MDCPLFVMAMTSRLYLFFVVTGVPGLLYASVILPWYNVVKVLLLASYLLTLYCCLLRNISVTKAICSLPHTVLLYLVVVLNNSLGLPVNGAVKAITTS